MKTDNKIIDVQEVVFRQLKRLDDDELMEKNGTKEIARSNVISNNAQTFIKGVYLNLKIMEYAKRSERKVKSLMKELGVSNEGTGE